jgi:hypothetical protein
MTFAASFPREGHSPGRIGLGAPKPVTWPRPPLIITAEPSEAGGWWDGGGYLLLRGHWVGAVNGSCPLIVQSPAPRLRPATVAEMRQNPAHEPAPAIVQQWKSVRRHTPSIMSLQY